MFFLSIPNVCIYYSTYSSHNTTMLQSINLRMYPYGLDTSKTFWSSKNLVHTFFLSFNPAAAWRLRGDKTLRERTKKIGLNTKHSIFHDRTQSSICQYCDCLVMLCHSLLEKIGRILKSSFYKKHFYAVFSLKNIYNMFKTWL